MKESYLKKYFVLLHNFCGSNLIPCSSRRIACIIADEKCRIVSLSYNGPPRDCYHSYHKEWLNQLIRSGKLNEDDLNILRKEFGTIDNALNVIEENKKCVRRVLNCDSGEREDLCLCVHAEQNAIINANDKLDNTELLIYGPTPCFNCARMIINANIKSVYYIEEKGIYDNNAAWLLNESKINLFPVSLKFIGI
jgi:deoxycytidylate deaminase